MKYKLFQEGNWFYLLDTETMTYKMFHSFERLKDLRVRLKTMRMPKVHDSYFKKKNFTEVAGFDKINSVTLQKYFPEYFL